MVVENCAHTFLYLFEIHGEQMAVKFNSDQLKEEFIVTILSDRSIKPFRIWFKGEEWVSDSHFSGRRKELFLKIRDYVHYLHDRTE